MLFRGGIDQRLRSVHRTDLAKVDGSDFVGIDLLPAVDVVEHRISGGALPSAKIFCDGSSEFQVNFGSRGKLTACPFLPL
jgi:hypothetical protein